MSKRPVPEKVLRDIDVHLLRLVAADSRSRAILRELLTETERLMLAKRLAAILLLAEEASYYRICTSLGMSTSTIKRLHQELLGEEFLALERMVRSAKSRERFLETVTTLGSLLPPRGKGRWRRIDKMLAH